MTAAQALGLYANMPRLRAERVLERVAYSGIDLTADQIYDLVLDAREDEELAARAFKARRHAELRAGITPS